MAHSYAWRIYFVFFLIVLVGAGIAGRAFYFQIVKNGYYAALARGQQVEYIDSEPLRGDIFFQDKFVSAGSPGEGGRILAATNKERFLLYAVPREIADSEAVIRALGLKKDEVQEKFLNKDDPYEPLAHKLTLEEAEKIKSLNLPGIYVRKEISRHYPFGDLASHILGFLGYQGDERIGQYGIEGFYDEVLRGKEGVVAIPFLSFESERNGRVVPGSDIVLTVDYNIQFMVEQKLREAKEKFSAEGISAIVLDPKTGEIIASAALDSFDPNYYGEVTNIDIFLNDITQKMFEPGSIFKPFVVAAGLETGKISPATQYTDTGSVTIGGYTIRNANERTYGMRTMTNVLELSINTGAVFMEKIIGHDIFREYIERFGFGKETQIDVQGEVRGDIKNILSTSRDINFATASFGQGIAATPIQVVSAFSAFANRGVIMKPHIAREIIEPNGKRKFIEPEVLARPVSSKTAGQVTSMLASVVENGYGKKAKVRGYKVAGKTGTAQVPAKDGKGYSDKTIHTFLGFAPAYDPRFIALIKIDNPQGINFSTESATPLFSEIAEYILHYYEIPPGD